eukprot:GDKJ01049528.1.p1 GENE.GDKJ01049528.1~~GDKJ01049528.1.p1  ORF type:complete len:206 (+),score=36.79 GDKJ01049528.1:32-649(+)
MSSSVIHQPGWKLALESFAFRQFDDACYSGTKIAFDKFEFTKKVNEIVEKVMVLHPGYAPFCKHVFVPNFTTATPGCVNITDEIKPLIESDYVARRPDELAVLSRWVSKSRIPEQAPAKFLDLILYSKEQCAKEAVAMNLPPPPESAPEWLIISIKAQDEDYELPMNPITMMRNTLISEGGSGVEIDREKYRESVAYWKNHVLIQ